MFWKPWYEISGLENRDYYYYVFVMFITCYTADIHVDVNTKTSDIVGFQNCSDLFSLPQVNTF